MPGFFSKVGTYLAGGGNAAASRTIKGAMFGGAVGGAYGAMSEDTSVLGGMMGGATMGAAAGRYGGAGIMAARTSGRGILSPMGAARAYGSAFGSGVTNMARRDAMKLRVMGRSGMIRANRGYGKIRGMF